LISGAAGRKDDRRNCNCEPEAKGVQVFGCHGVPGFVGLGFDVRLFRFGVIVLSTLRIRARLVEYRTRLTGWVAPPAIQAARRMGRGTMARLIRRLA
jgi:hypothetical protein